MVEYKAPVDKTSGVTAGFASGTNTATFTDFIGWQIIPEKIGFGTLRADQYTWNSTTGEMVLTEPTATFQDQEYWKFQFQVRITEGGSLTNYNSGLVKQYPYSLVIKIFNTYLSQSATINYMCRREGGAAAKRGFNETDGVKYVIYMPLPVQTIPIGTPVEVYNSENEVYCADTVKQFQRDQFNAKIWI